VYAVPPELNVTVWPVKLSVVVFVVPIPLGFRTPLNQTVLPAAIAVPLKLDTIDVTPLAEAVQMWPQSTWTCTVAESLPRFAPVSWSVSDAVLPTLKSAHEPSGAVIVRW
jgi:hypothetical protein